MGGGLSKNVTTKGYLGLPGDVYECYTIKVKDMILADAIEAKKAEDLRAATAFASASDGVLGV